MAYHLLAVVVCFVLLMFFVYIGWSVYRGVVADDCHVLNTITTHNGIVRIVPDTCKEGLPHTTDANTIYLTREVWDGPNRESILIHERVHLSQKRRPELWAEFYRRHWDYTLFVAAPASLPATYIQTRRPNPDTDAAPWAVWRHRYVFFPSSTDGRLKNAQVLVWDLDQKRLVPIPEAWYAMFCVNRAVPRQYEHPHELSAEFLTLGSGCVAADMLRSWWQEQEQEQE